MTFAGVLALVAAILVLWFAGAVLLGLFIARMLADGSPVPPARAGDYAPAA